MKLRLEFPERMPPAISLGSGRWRTTERWPFRIGNVHCVVPGGFICDLYSVPFPWSIVIPRDERDNRPALIHDWLYATVGLRPHSLAPSIFPRQVCDLALRTAAEMCGLHPIRCRSIHLGVRLGGWVPWRKLERAGFSFARPCLREALR